MTTSQDAHSLPQLGQVIAACMEALNDGDYQVARHLADRAQALARTTGPLGRANAALVTGMAEQAVGDTDTAAEKYTKAANLTRPHLAEPDGICLYLHARMELAALHRAEGRYHEAGHILHDALTTTAAADPAPHDLALLHNELGVVSKYSGDFDLAAASYRAALALLESVLPGDDPELATLHHNIGGLAHARGDYAAAEGPARRAVEIREKALGPDHPDTATDKAALAPILLGLDRLEEAEQLLHQALTVLERTRGTGHPDYAIALGNLAATTHQLGHHQSAEILYQRALHLLEQALGPDHPDLAPVLTNLAELHHNLGNADLAHTLSTRARAILTASVRRDHPTLTALTERTLVCPGSDGVGSLDN